MNRAMHPGIDPGMIPEHPGIDAPKAQGFPALEGDDSEMSKALYKADKIWENLK